MASVLSDGGVHGIRDFTSPPMRQWDTKFPSPTDKIYRELEQHQTNYKNMETTGTTDKYKNYP